MAIETLLLKQPTVSEDEVAFLYAGEIWIVGRDGSYPRRLTAQRASKGAPHFSPDGQWIAFSGNYDGNMSVYVVPRTGGSPRRLSYHPYEDWVRGWTPDGKRVLFTSARDAVTLRAPRLFTVSVDGGLPEPLPMHMAFRGAFSPDGTHLAYTPYMEAFWSWKRYRGGQTAPIWVLDLATYEHIEVPHENASDTFPCWMGEAIYFLSDRNQVMNLFRWVPGTERVEQLTFHTDFDIRSLAAGGGILAYEQAGRIHLYDPEVCTTITLSISIAADLPSIRPHYRKAARFIQSCDISPTGKRAVFEARGDIFTVPANKGDVRNLTKTPGVSERNPSWSPDGQSIAFFSDRSGEYELVIVDQRGNTKQTVLLPRRSFFYNPIWSPDSKMIAYTDKALNLDLVRLEDQHHAHVDTDTYDHPLRSLDPAWSPDSRWLAYTKRLDNHLRALFLYDVEAGQSHQVTDGMSDASDACFSRDGKYLFFASSSDVGLNTGWLDMSSFDRPVTRSLYVLVLSKEEPSPLAPESDEEEADEKSGESDEKDETGPAEQATDAAKGDKPDGNSRPGEKEPEGEKKKPVEVKIDLEGMDQRILALPLPARDYKRLRAAEGKLFFMEFVDSDGDFEENPCYNLKFYDIGERTPGMFKESVGSFWISADGKMLMFQTAMGKRFAIVGTEGRPSPLDGALGVEEMENYVDPVAEWQQMFWEAIRIHRDFFYDPEYHGLDLEATTQKYLPFLEHVGHRDDLNYLLAELSGELVVGHAYVGGGDIPTGEPVWVGLLGADYEVVDGYYRIKRIYPGMNWHPELRAPLTEPGVNVKEGEYIFSVNGRPLRWPTNIFSLFEKTVGCITELMVGPTTNEADARPVTVRPVAQETGLRHWSWVENNRKKVDELSNGRVAYVYMADTSVGGYASFNRYYFSQLNKEAVVLDERFNGGGMVADYVIDMLDRPLLSYWATREGKEFASPNASIYGPKVMIINELAGSGGDALPQFFRRRGLGKLVGKRTWGGLIGIYDLPVLMDGGMFTSPRMAIFSPQGEWEVENVGVTPDIEVEMTPRLVIAGRDPQLEKAVEVVLAELEAAPGRRVTRPAPARRAAPKL